MLTCIAHTNFGDSVFLERTDERMRAVCGEPIMETGSVSAGSPPGT
jgi:hypothetical protein